MHPPFARGVTHLMYVGDDAPASGTKVNALAALSGIIAVFGKDLGVSKSTRYAAAAVAIGSLVYAYKRPA
jgi:hypothetical protein